MFRVLIQNSVTMLFLRDAETGNWCERATKAKDFGSSLTALNHAVKEKLPDCQVILTFGSPEFDIQLPVNGSLPKVVNGVRRLTARSVNGSVAEK